MKRLCFLVCLLSALTLSADTTFYMVSAGGPGWTTDFVLTYDLSPATEPNTPTVGPMTVNLHDCVYGSGHDTITVQPRSQVRVIGVEKLQCSPFTLVEQSFFNIEAKSILTYKNGSEFGYLVVPPLHVSLTKEGDNVEISGVINDGSTTTQLALFNLDSSTPLTVDILDSNYQLLSTEYITVEHGFTFYNVKAPMNIGALRITEGYLGIGAPHNPYKSRVVGFAIVGKAGAPEVKPF